MRENLENLKRDQNKLLKNNKILRKDIASLSKGTRLSEEIVLRAQRYRKERDILADEVERLRNKIEKLEFAKMQDSVVKPISSNVVKLNRVVGLGFGVFLSQLISL